MTAPNSSTARRLAHVVGAALVALASGTVPAEDEAIERCRDADTEAARIACLEDALRGRDDGTAAAPEPNEARAPDAAPAAATDREPDERAPPRAAASAATPATPAPAPPAAEGIGAEQVRARNETRGEREARLDSVSGLQVAAYTTVPYRRLQVELQNGQVWRQVKGDTQHIRVTLDRNQTVDINESGLGGYRLRLNEMRRTLAVERVR